MLVKLTTGAVGVDNGDQTSGRDVNKPHPDYGRRLQSLMQSISVSGNGRAFFSTFRKCRKIFSGNIFLQSLFKTIGVLPLGLFKKGYTILALFFFY
jgi:hypothetical protein